MAIGPQIRKLLGTYERPVSDAYRNFFMSMNDVGLNIKETVNTPKSILEVGCGEGAITEVLNREFPEATIVGIDIIHTVGRQFRGDRSKVTFEHASIEQHNMQYGRKYDLIYLGDVLHHVPKDFHNSFLTEINKSLNPNGTLIIKDIDRNNSFIYFLVHFTDRYITGDNVNYLNETEFVRLINNVLGTNISITKKYIKPWKTNIIFYINKA
ncbi:MAG: class I SAM-dependent methyltransferase [Cytophagales bacterium]|nr:class I SAM-dependent methyltransferase [Cytophagales bacterium]